MIGTMGFCGERLREAREARGFSAIQFAGRVGLTKQMVNLYERGKHTPAPATFDIICDALRFPKQFFLRPPVAPTTAPVFYRSLKSATRPMRDRAERMYGWFRQLVATLSRFVELPSADVPQLNLPSDPAQLTDDMVDAAATQVRRYWGLGDGVISNVVFLLENHGIVATRFMFGTDKLDAFSNWDYEAGRPFVILGADKECQVRSRFDAAHELAHVIFHRAVLAGTLQLPAMFNRIESQAHRFARAFLLPKATFGEEHLPPSIDALLELKVKWRVSLGVVIARAAELGLFTPTQERNLWIARSRRGWHLREPYDDEWRPEGPVLVPRAIELLTQANVLRPTALSNSLALRLEDVEAVAGLPSGSFQPDTTEAVSEPIPQLLVRNES